ncbi:MAG TPA: ATP-binding protein, partial [Kofleriaceae bacterium]|nr:ATP-binding protein [Kofleriaceae bacterium]
EIESEEVRLDEMRRDSESHHWRITFVLFAAGVISLAVILGLVFVQRRDAEASRRRSLEVARAHALFQVVLAGADMGITVQSKTGALVYANAAGAAMLGFETPEALLDASGAELLARFEVFDDDGSRLAPEQLPSRAALRGESPAEISIRFRQRGSREERRSLLRSVASRDSTGEVEFVINFFREITAQARRDEQRAFLLRAMDELNSSLDHEHTLAVVARMAVPSLADWCALDILDGDRIKRVAVAHVDPDKLAFVDALERRYPSDPSSATGVPQIIRTGTAEFIADIPHEMLQAAAVDDEHLRLIDSLQLHSYIGVPLKVSSKTIGAITFAMAESGRRYTSNDLEFAESLADRAALAIENARLFRELERANAATRELLANETERRTVAENASRFADVFIGILGHDLRNPLNAVLMAAQLMRHRQSADPKTLDRIESSSRRMSAMVTQLLDLARSRLGGGIEISRKRVLLASVVNAVTDELRLVHPDRAIVVDGGDISGDWDEDRLAQVLSNLVGNALEHGDPSKPVHVRIAQVETKIEISVRNEGTPIPVELLPLLFDPYRRVTARGARSKGLGLGLFITQQIVDAHGGRIDVHSDDASTTFTVVLPHPSLPRATVDTHLVRLS